MKNASIISIGNEVLNGQTVDTNTTYLCSKLLSVGIPVVSSYTVPDEIDAIVRALKLAGNDADVVLITGGLGPTDDDLTRQALSKFLGRKLQLQNELLSRIQDYFTSRDLKMPDKNEVQAYIPAGTTAIVNELGTAPGIMAQWEGQLFFAMPGVPTEMERMFDKYILPQLKDSVVEQAVIVRKLKCFGTGESNIAALLGNLCQRGRNPLINLTVSYGVISVHIVATAKDKQQAQQMIEKDEKLLRDRLGNFVYGTDEQTLADVVGQTLAEQKKTLAVAESCTGGILAGMIINIPGASRYFTQGWITYTNDAKIHELGVPSDLIESYGAVSEPVAAAMAKGARRKAQTELAIAITGIAGPTGGSEQKPVGLVYISVDCEQGCETSRFVFSNGRARIRMRAAQTALNMLRLKL